MTRIRVILLSLLAVFAISAVASASASAKGWWVCQEVVEGTGKFDSSLCNKEGPKHNWEILAVKAGQSFEFSDIEPVAGGGNKSVIVFHKGEIKIECPEISFVNAAGGETGESNPNPPDTLKSEAFMEGTNGGSIHEIQFSECVVTLTPPRTGCALAPVGEDDISTNPMNVILSTTTPTVTLTPVLKEGKEIFASFKLNASCGVLAGEYKVSGSTVFTISEPESCKEVHQITISETPSKLVIAGEKVEKFEVVRNLEGVESDKCWDVK
jgi:hypothetical protein